MSRKSISRREFIQMAGLTGGAALLAACAPQATPTTEAVKPVEQPTQPPAPPESAVTISWWNQFSTPTCQELFPRIVKDFMTLHTNIKVEFEITGGPPGGGDYTEVLMARIAAGNPPDTITLWTPPSQFGARGALLAIDNLMDKAQLAKKDAFYTGPLESCMWKGKTFGLPASAGAGCLFINKKTFEDAGVSTKREDFPTTWDGLRDLAIKFNKKDDKGEISLAGFVPWTQSWLKPLWSELNGGKIFDAKKLQYSVNSENIVELLNYWVKWLDDQFGGDIEKFNTLATWGDVYPDSAFQLGKTAIDMSGSWACTDAAIPFEWEVMKFPVGPKGTKSLTGFWPNWWAIPKGTKYPDEAFLFSEYLCTEGWVTWYVNGTMDTPAWKNAPADAVTKALEKGVGLDRAKEIHKFFATYLNDTCEMWTSPIEDFASDTINQAIDEVLHKTKQPADALENAQTLIQTKLDETMKSL